ncbi:hypothetical protein PVAND_006201 [Polypedilum vanderplanki]|uniref:Uncharacterized protein n=1 Tax=Polypedilum vanderplanki TaxID=319348 RepID=A0A9J6C2W0_POLVA|nr:hypothetical protein PVAND_006201 [Polypedilum vanderplanki]
MQKQLLQIADRIPDDILLTLLKCFAKLLTCESEQTTKSSGPFIRAFAKIRDDGERQFSVIAEEDEDQKINEQTATEVADEGDNECTFNYKITNVVTQEVLYSMGNNEDDNVKNEIDENQQQQTQQDDDQEIIESLQNAEENTADVVATSDDDENNNNNIDEEEKENVESVNNEITEVEIEEVEPEIEKINNDISSNNDSDYDDDQIVENIEKEIDGDSVESEKPQIDDDERENIQPLEKVSLDDIQREIQEMQMFLFNKGITQENKSQSNINHELITAEKSQAKVEDGYKVDVCINLKKKSSERKHTKSKAILSNYINKDSHMNGDNRNHIFDPSVPNTPEDFLKEKSVTEKINKKKQKIKHLDMSWQKLCDDQKKVYKHSNFKIPKAERSIVDEQKNI